MSSEEDEVLLLLSVVRRRQRRRRKNIQRNFWTHPYWKNNVKSNQYILTQQLFEHPDKFQKFYRMHPGTFLKLCDLLNSHCTIKDTRWRESISIQERLSIFLRYISTGLTFTALSYEFFRGVSTISEIVEHMAVCLWDILQADYMPMPSSDDWTVINETFYQQWNIPNCLGSLDGKHVRLKSPPNSGSAYYNYHGFFSLVLLGCVDADSLFTWISVGDYGRNSDGRVIHSTGFLQALENNVLNIPGRKPLPNTEDPPFPLFFISDQAFPLKEYLFRPYPKNGENDVKRVFNYRLSRARKTVECAFGMLAHKFRIFLSQIECKPDKATDIVKASCILHNFIKMHDGKNTTPQYENEVEEAYIQWTPLQRAPPQVHTSRAKELRDMLSHYFTKPENALPFQNMYN